MRKKWTDKEEQVIIDHYAALDIEELVKLLPGRSKTQIYAKAGRMGFRKENETPIYDLGGIADQNFEEAPHHLNETGKRYWYSYLKELNGVNFTEYSKLADLCMWEQKKEDTLTKSQDQDDVIEYKDETGKVKHTQPSTYFSNLKAIQYEINQLRDKIFKEVNTQKKTETQPTVAKKNW